jgi:hypothetical protein
VYVSSSRHVAPAPSSIIAAICSRRCPSHAGAATHATMAGRRSCALQATPPRHSFWQARRHRIFQSTKFRRGGTSTAQDRNFEWHPHKSRSRPTLPRPGIRAENASPPLAVSLAEMFRDSGGLLARDTRRIPLLGAGNGGDERPRLPRGKRPSNRGLRLEAWPRIV